MDKPIANCSIIFREPDGNEIMTSVQLGRLRQEEDMKWACDVEIPGVDRVHTIHGVDSLHALILAAGYLADRLQHFVSNGASLLSPDTREPASINEILPRV
jgi:hypothetical protein